MPSRVPPSAASRSSNCRPNRKRASRSAAHWRGARTRVRGRPQWSSRRLLDAEAELLDHLLTHQELLDLAGYGHRETVDEFDVARHLVMRDLPLAEGSDLLGRGGLAVAQT